MFILEDPQIWELQRERKIPAGVGNKISGSEDDSKGCLLFKELRVLKYGGSELQP